MTNNIHQYESTILNIADLLRITIDDDDEWTTFTITTTPRVADDPDAEDGPFTGLQDYYEHGLIPQLAALDSKTQLIAVETLDACYSYDPHRDTLVRKQGGQMTALGPGKIEIKATYEHADEIHPERIEIIAVLVICNARSSQKSGASHTT